MDRKAVPLGAGHVRAIRWAIKAAIGAASAQEEIPAEERHEIIMRMSALDDYIMDHYDEPHVPIEQLRLDV